MAAKSNVDMNSLALPKRKVGYQSPEAKARYEADLDRWCAAFVKIYDERAEDDDNFDVSSRGWCYLLEADGLSKGDFDTAEKVINDCRKSGKLPLDICGKDKKRATENLETINNPDPKIRAATIVDYVNEAEEYYHPHSFWDAQEYYIEMMVEKSDLVGLFRPVCELFRIPLWNGGGWQDLNSRADAMRRFKYWDERGKQCVLLNCGDHDPGAFHIVNFIRSNLRALADVVGWWPDPDRLIIDRFGLDEAFINKHRITKIENLQTSKKGDLPLDDLNHNDHGKDYVQNYIKKFGVWKVEATALVVPRLVPHARALCRKAILKYLPASAPSQYESSLELPRRKMRAEIQRLLKVKSKESADYEWPEQQI